MSSKYAHRNPTIVSRVYDELTRRDDFMTTRMIMVSLNESFNRVGAALHHLKSHKAAECLSSDGQLWWFLTPESDTRGRVVHERITETKPRKPRKRKSIPYSGGKI